MNRHTPTRSVKNPTLDDTVKAMIVLAHQGKKDLEVRRLVENICSRIKQGDYNSEVLAIYYWVCQNIRYMRDIHNVEFVKTPHRLLKTKSGDCDDMATLLAAMLMACGNVCRYVVVAFQGDNWSHVFCQVMGKQGKWITLDPVARERTAEMHGRVTKQIFIPVG